MTDLTSYSDVDFIQTVTTSLVLAAQPLHMQIRTSADDPTVWVYLTTGDGLEILSSSSVRVTILQPKLENLPAGVYVYSIVATSQNGANRSEVARGSFTHIHGPTRWDAGTP